MTRSGPETRTPSNKRRWGAERRPFGRHANAPSPGRLRAIRVGGCRLRAEVRVPGAVAAGPARRGGRIPDLHLLGLGAGQAGLLSGTRPRYLLHRPAERDVSDSPVWQPLVGRLVTVGYRDRTWQVI